MSGASRREHWRPLGIASKEQPAQPSITSAIEGLTERVSEFRASREKAMSDSENQQPPAAPAAPAATPLPPAPTIAAQPAPATSVRPKPKPGSFAASIRAMLNEARSGLDRAKADGMAQVQKAVDELNEAKEATGRVTAQVARTISEEAADARAELGQFTNDI